MMPSTLGPPGLPRIIGHRGAAAQAPENTLAGFREAARQGARWVEFDVRLTACGHLVLMHDDDLHRTTNGAGPVAAYSLAALSDLDAGSWFGPAFTSERVPTLEEALAAAADLGLGVNIEAKAEGPAGLLTARAVASVLAGADTRYVILSSLDICVVQEWARRVPEVPRALVLDEYRTDWAALAQDMGCSALHCNHEWLDRQHLAELCRDPSGPRLRAYTVNAVERAQELFAAGVEGVFTDCPGRLVAATSVATPGATRHNQRRPPAA